MGISLMMEICPLDGAMRQIWKAMPALFRTSQEITHAEKPFLLFVLKLHRDTVVWV